MRSVLIGIRNPHSSDPSDALAPYPVGCSGFRLWKMLYDVSGTPARKYMRLFSRMNVDDPNLEAAVDELPEGSTVVLLGEEVRRHFGLPKQLIHPIVRDGLNYRQVPHPSGRCHFYNDPLCRRLVGMMLEDLIR